jgi:hypothetical protein
VTLDQLYPEASSEISRGALAVDVSTALTRLSRVQMEAWRTWDGRWTPEWEALTERQHQEYIALRKAMMPARFVPTPPPVPPPPTRIPAKVRPTGPSPALLRGVAQHDPAWSVLVTSAPEPQARRVQRSVPWNGRVPRAPTADEQMLRRPRRLWPRV